MVPALTTPCTLAALYMPVGTEDFMEVEGEFTLESGSQRAASSEQGQHHQGTC